MTSEQLGLLCGEVAGQIVEEYINADPASVAASKQVAARLASSGVAGAAGIVATQIKYLQRARTKLPHYFEARCIIPPLSFEQAGSMECAAHKRYEGDECIDLTCGLGVDSANFASRFRHVTALERNPVLADVARYNFARMGIMNIDVVNMPAEEFLARPGVKADMVYADPDRRGGNNRKLVLLEDCSPDILALRGRLAAITDRLVIKLSPLFDAVQAVRIFGPGVIAEAVSLRGECKELLVETGPHIPHPVLRASAAGGETFEAWLAEGNDCAPEPFPTHFRYLAMPDASLRKMRLARRFAAANGAWCESDNGYIYCDKPIESRLCRCFEILSLEPYNARRLAAKLNADGIKRVQIMQLGFPIQNAEIARRLGVKEGAEAIIAFTIAGGRQIAMFLRETSE